MIGIELLYVSKVEDNFQFQVKNEDKQTINFKQFNTTLKTSTCPENAYPTLFLQGTRTEDNDRIVEATSKQTYEFIKTILYYNQSLGRIENIWISDFQFKCKHCNKTFRYAELHSTHSEYCNDCISLLKMCSSCGSVGATHVFGNDIFCDECVVMSPRNGGIICQYCEQKVPAGKSKIIRIEGDYHGNTKEILLCPDCWDKEIEFGHEHHYHYRPDTFYFWDINEKGKREKVTNPSNKKLYMGTEIEAVFNPYSHTNIVIAKVLNIYGREKERLMYAKHDGTVPEPGSEFVTHPMTLDMIKSMSWEGLFKNIIKPDTFGVGGHIHVNKDAFHSMGHVYKFINFLRNNVSYVTFIGERPLQHEWCKARSGNGNLARIAKRYKQNTNVDRYEMINFTSETIELRFFWSPSTVGMLYKNAEFVDSLFHYTINTPLHFSVADYEAYVEAQSSRYPYLYNYIYSRNKDMTFLPNQTPQGNSIDMIVCSTCGEEVHRRAACIIDGSYYCNDCTSYCGDCDTTYIAGDECNCDLEPEQAREWGVRSSAVDEI